MSVLELLAFEGARQLLFPLVRCIARMSRESTRIQNHAKQIMAGREALSPDEFAGAHFLLAERPIAAKIQTFLAEILIVDASRIHPDDRLVEDLGFGQIDGLDPNFLGFDVEREFGVSLSPGGASIKTVRDLVKYIFQQRNYLRPGSSRAISGRAV